MKYLTLTEAAKRLDVDVSVIQSWIDQGLLKTVSLRSDTKPSPPGSMLGLITVDSVRSTSLVSEPLVEEDALFALSEEAGWLELVWEAIEKTEK